MHYVTAVYEFVCQVINLRHACAVRVTVLGLCVCVCLSTLFLYLAQFTRKTRNTSDFSVTWTVEFKMSFNALLES